MLWRPRAARTNVERGGSGEAPQRNGVRRSARKWAASRAETEKASRAMISETRSKSITPSITLSSAEASRSVVNEVRQNSGNLRVSESSVEPTEKAMCGTRMGASTPCAAMASVELELPPNTAWTPSPPKESTASS